MHPNCNISYVLRKAEILNEGEDDETMDYKLPDTFDNQWLSVDAELGTVDLDDTIPGLRNYSVALKYVHTNDFSYRYSDMFTVNVVCPPFVTKALPENIQKNLFELSLESPAKMLDYSEWMINLSD